MKRRSDWVLFSALIAWASVAWAQEALVHYFGSDIQDIPLVTWLCVAAYALAGTLARLQTDIKSGEVEKNFWDIAFVLVIGQIVGHLMFLACEAAMSKTDGHMPYWLEGLLIFGGAFNRKLVLDFVSSTLRKLLSRIGTFISKFTG